MNSKKTLLAALLAALMLTSGCGSSASQQQTDTAAQTGETGTSNVASASDMTEVEEVVEEGMTPISGDKVKDGTYSVAVKSSSKMFDITACELTVEGGKMTATMHMGGKGYLYVYMGTGEQAAAADEHLNLIDWPIIQLISECCNLFWLDKSSVANIFVNPFLYFLIDIGDINSNRELKLFVIYQIKKFRN